MYPPFLGVPLIFSALLPFHLLIFLQYPFLFPASLLFQKSLKFDVIPSYWHLIWSLDYVVLWCGPLMWLSLVLSIGMSPGVFSDALISFFDTAPWHVALKLSFSTTSFLILVSWSFHPASLNFPQYIITLSLFAALVSHFPHLLFMPASLSFSASLDLLRSLDGVFCCLILPLVLRLDVTH